MGDDEMAESIHMECMEKFYEKRSIGSMQPTAGVIAVDGHECWVPFPSRKGTSPELDHALRVLFGLPHEIQKHGFPGQLKVPTMAHLSCFSPNSGREGVHVDNNTEKGGRELTLVLFVSSGWSIAEGGQFRA